MSKKMKQLKNRLESLPCPYCKFKGNLLSLLGHALSKHKINLIARLSKRKRKHKGKGAKLRFILTSHSSGHSGL